MLAASTKFGRQAPVRVVTGWDGTQLGLRSNGRVAAATRQIHEEALAILSRVSEPVRS